MKKTWKKPVMLTIGESELSSYISAAASCGPNMRSISER
jgi:hypothetical protein